jgi:hypothetical protein
MKIEFAFRTYNSFGANATLTLASRWVEQRIAKDYGGSIRTVLVEACCRSQSPPKKTLEHLHDRFEAWIDELPHYEVREKGAELRVCYYTMLYRADEIQRDSQVLAIRMFGNLVAKSAELLGSAPSEIAGLDEFRIGDLAKDMHALSKGVPQTLDALAELYLGRRSGAA